MFPTCHRDRTRSAVSHRLGLIPPPLLLQVGAAFGKSVVRELNVLRCSTGSCRIFIPADRLSFPATVQMLVRGWGQVSFISAPLGVFPVMYHR